MHTHHFSTEFINFNPHGCRACWHCVKACPKQAIGKVGFFWHRHAVIVNADACIGCGECVKECRHNCFSYK